MVVENAGTIPLAKVKVHLYPDRPTYTCIDHGPWQLATSPLQPGQSETFTFTIEATGDGSGKIVLSMKVISQGYGARWDETIAEPVDGTFTVTLWFVFSAAGGIVAIAAVMGYKKWVASKKPKSPVAGKAPGKKGGATTYATQRATRSRLPRS